MLQYSSNIHPGDLESRVQQDIVLKTKLFKEKDVG